MADETGRRVVRVLRGVCDSGRSGADHLKYDAGYEDTETCPQASGPAVGVLGQVAGVVTGVRVPSGRIAERGTEGDQPAAGHPGDMGTGLRLAEDHHRSNQEHHYEDGESPSLKRVHKVVAEERDR